MSDKFILEGHTAVPCDDLMEWARWMENHEARRVAHDRWADVRVSTVFLGLDHSFGHGLPLLFETMIFGGPHNHWMDRYMTWEGAEAGHKRIVQRLRDGQPPTEAERDERQPA